ncbi:LuxR C-terminal-related transcriptional regulator [Actinokineospora sp.]|uniref:LuxR C-terminal-related transcriptional regulator n=1 Tax=Actinokineospora sp. TaxID=1872133 RepID=UPI00403846F8
MTRALIAPVFEETIGYPGVGQAHKQADVYQSLFDRSGICMASVDLALKVQEANDQFTRDLARSTGGVVGHELFDFLHQGAQVHLRRLFVRLIEGRCERVTERVLGLRSGEYLFPAQLTAVAVRERSPMVSTILVMLQWDESAGDIAARTARRKVLTDLDARILEGVAMGMSTVNLAAKLYLSRQGVEYHVGTMLKKLKATNRAALVSRAYAMGVLNAGTWPPQVEPEFIK